QGALWSSAPFSRDPSLKSTDDVVALLTSRGRYGSTPSRAQGDSETALPYSHHCGSTFYAATWYSSAKRPIWIVPRPPASGLMSREETAWLPRSRGASAAPTRSPLAAT